MSTLLVLAGSALATLSLMTACTAGSTTSKEAPGREVSPLSKGGGMVSLDAGRYEAWRIGSAARYEVEVPDGWRVLSGTFFNAPSDGHGIFFVASLPKDRTDLAKHPCRNHALRRVGPTVSDFVLAMRAQPVWEVSEPRPVALDGRDGLYVEVELPADVDPARCVDGVVSEYESGPDGMATDTSYKGRWWVLQVAGERLVVMARCYDTCSEQDLDTMTAMARSISFST